METVGGRVEISAAKTLVVDSIGKTYYYADVDDTIEIVLIPDEGYNAVGLNSHISSRYDPETGKYYITVPSTGKIDIQGLFEGGRVIPVNPSTEDEPMAPSSEPAMPATGIAESVAGPVLLNAEAMNLLGIAGDAVSAGVYNFSAYNTAAGFESGIDKVIQSVLLSAVGTNVKPTVTIYSDNPIAINKSILNKICNSNIDFVYIFVYNGHVYSVTIPAGTDASMLLQETQSEGPLYIGALLGTTQLIK